MSITVEVMHFAVFLPQDKILADGLVMTLRARGLRDVDIRREDLGSAGECIRWETNEKILYNPDRGNTDAQK